MRTVLRLAQISILALVMLTGCKTKVTLTPTSRTPAATAKLVLTEDDNANTLGSLDVEYLAPPEQLRKDLTVYVVWVRPTGTEQWFNTGQFVVSKKRAGTVKFSVPHREFDISVTAEAEGTVDRRSEFVVLDGQVSR
jgi:hypothetical protein